VNVHVIDYLVHFSNILMLVSYSVRDILWLRWFAVAAALTNIPYFLLQDTVLCRRFSGHWYSRPLISTRSRAYIWNAAPWCFPKTNRNSTTWGSSRCGPREFLSLVLAGEWKNAAAGDQVLTEGKAVSSICVAVSGTVQFRKQGKDLVSLKPGHLIGTALALVGDPSPVDATFTDSGRYMCWPLHNIRSFLDRRPELRVNLQSLVNRDLAGKLEGLVSA
jgi:CRP-like cAMP-binding protein